jgi:pilus assembly protein TadC
MIKRYVGYIYEQARFVLGEQQAGKYIKKRNIGLFAVPVGILLIFILCAWKKNDSRILLAYPVVTIFITYYIFDYRIVKRAKDRRRQMRLELAEILERMAVLLDAGVTLWNAAVIVSDGNGNGSSGAFEEELRCAVRRFQGDSGYYYDPEAAFEEMAVKCSDSTVSTFVSLIVQNSRKGTDELAELLRIQAVNARSERRMLAKQLAEEASTLMLLPSVLVLIAIMALAVAPAIIKLI